MVIYIDEAHAVDVWPIGESAGTINKKHLTLDDRKKCAKQFVDRLDYQIPIYLDNMDNEFTNLFKVWPFRALIFNNNKLVYSSQPHHSEYNIMEIYDFLNKV